MTDDTTKTFPDDGRSSSDSMDGGDRIGALIDLVRIMSTSLEDVKMNVEDVKTRLGTLEKSVAERLHDTRPVWERALAEIAETRSEMRESLHKLGGKIDLLINDVFTVRAENKSLEKRIDNLESRAS
jgi:chromosome segregation ATPase